MRLPIVMAASLALAACATSQAPTPAEAEDFSKTATAFPADMFMAALKRHCGKAYRGRMVSNDNIDRGFADETLVMHVRKCDEREVRIPFHVGDDRSRTWILTRTADGLRLKHDHRHEDGKPDDVTMYGGDTAAPGTATRQEFPVDDYSIAMFRRERLDQSVTNIWAMEVTDRIFAYELRRPTGRFFRVEFDLTRPVAPPPPPWGS